MANVVDIMLALGFLEIEDEEWGHLDINVMVIWTPNVIAQ